MLNLSLDSMMRSGIIGNEQYGTYKDASHHPFHQKIVSNLSLTKVSDQTFEKWKKGVIGGFNQNNWLGVNIDKVGSGSS